MSDPKPSWYYNPVSDSDDDSDRQPYSSGSEDDRHRPSSSSSSSSSSAPAPRTSRSPSSSPSPSSPSPSPSPPPPLPGRTFVTAEDGKRVNINARAAGEAPRKKRSRSRDLDRKPRDRDRDPDEKRRRQAADRAVKETEKQEAKVREFHVIAEYLFDFPFPADNHAAVERICFPPLSYALWAFKQEIGKSHDWSNLVDFLWILLGRTLPSPPTETQARNIEQARVRFQRKWAQAGRSHGANTEAECAARQQRLFRMVQHFGTASRFPEPARAYLLEFVRANSDPQISDAPANVAAMRRATMEACRRDIAAGARPMPPPPPMPMPPLVSPLLIFSDDGDSPPASPSPSLHSLFQTPAPSPSPSPFLFRPPEPFPSPPFRPPQPSPSPPLASTFRPPEPSPSPHLSSPFRSLALGSPPPAPTASSPSLPLGSPSVSPSPVPPALSPLPSYPAAFPAELTDPLRALDLRIQELQAQEQRIATFLWRELGVSVPPTEVPFVPPPSGDLDPLAVVAALFARRRATLAALQDRIDALRVAWVE